MGRLIALYLAFTTVVLLVAVVLARLFHW